MGQLSVTIGPISATLPFDNTRGAAIIDGFIAAQGGPTDGTNEEKLQWYVDRVAEYTRDVYRRHRVRVAIVDAETTAEETLEQW